MKSSLSKTWYCACRYDTPQSTVVTAENGENGIEMLETLYDLIKIAQGLLKLVLHKEEQGKHIYCVLDNTTRYEYVIGSEVRS